MHLFYGPGVAGMHPGYSPELRLILMILNSSYKQFYFAFQQQADSKIQCVFRYRQSDVRWLLPASDYCRKLSENVLKDLITARSAFDWR